MIKKIVRAYRNAPANIKFAGQELKRQGFTIRTGRAYMDDLNKKAGDVGVSDLVAALKKKFNK